MLTGKVSYITAQNIYVKFQNTEKIHAGDTIFRKVDDKLIPLFIVENISSVSCVGKPLDKTEVKIDDDVAIKVHEKIVPVKQKTDKTVEMPSSREIARTGTDSIIKVAEIKRKQDLQGSLSVSSYSNLSNTAIANSQRMRYTFSIRASNLANSRISAESYITFSHKLNEWDTIRKNIFYAWQLPARGPMMPIIMLISNYWSMELSSRTMCQRKWAGCKVHLLFLSKRTVVLPTGGWFISSTITPY
ncbi:MAG: hypothetical protein NTW49_14925 [Bacteroidia bacterium]|nr:hypothetical protein [Bacteroidia bacterium]